MKKNWYAGCVTVRKPGVPLSCSYGVALNEVLQVAVYLEDKLIWNTYVVKSISFRTEFFALIWSVVITPAARGIIPKVSWASLLKASFLCKSCVTQL